MDFVLLFVLIFAIGFDPIFGMESEQQNLLFLAIEKLPENPGIEEIRNVIKALADQHEAMAKAMEKCEMEGQKDLALAQIYQKLTKLLKESADNGAELSKIGVEAVFLLAKSVGIPKEQILDGNDKNENKIEILKKLAKDWDKNDWNGKSNDQQNSYQRQRDTLKMILTAADDGNIGTIGKLAKNANSDRSSRRRKKRGILPWVIVVAAIIIVALVCVFLSRGCPGSSDNSASASANKSASASVGISMPTFEYSTNPGNIHYWIPKVNGGSG